MKKIVKLLALALALVMLVSAFVACGGMGSRLSGTYKGDGTAAGSSYEFDGKNFTYTATSGYMLKGSYEIKKIDDDYRIYLTVKESGASAKDLKVVEKPYVIGPNDGAEGVEYRFKGTDGKEFDGFIYIDTSKYVLVK